MQQIADWLKKLGMYEYAQRFAENGISFAALSHLTDQGLKDIGVLLGQWRIMLAAIQELAATAPSAPAPTEPARKDDVEPMKPHGDRPGGQAHVALGMYDHRVGSRCIV